MNRAMKVLSDIYPPEIKPVREGKYMVWAALPPRDGLSYCTFLTWNGMSWHYIPKIRCDKQDWHWRGLAFDPESAEPVDKFDDSVLATPGHWIPEVSDD